MLQAVREPAVAGTFYPADKISCFNEVIKLLQSNPYEGDIGNLKALIAPHAGYIYSGPIAAMAYNLLSKVVAEMKTGGPRFSRIVLLGPSHRVALKGMALCSFEYYRTPLGLVPLAKDMHSQLLTLPQVLIQDVAHEFEHCLEVHLPFLQSVLDDFSLIPIVVGQASAQSVSEVLAMLWRDSDTLVIGSSDLSHFLPYDEAQEMDGDTSRAIENCNTNLVGEQACGCFALNGLLLRSKQLGYQVRCLSLSNSGDTISDKCMSDKSRVVGYGAYAIH